ncbi:MAG: 5-formyltetrahydrofolate cyclo-ligase [Desulfovibrionaceae bacterium]
MMLFPDSTAVPAQKAALRTDYIARRRALAPATLAAWALAAQHAILADPRWRNARQVTLYMPIKGEMDTTLLREDAWARKVQVLLPRCRSDAHGRMDFVPCTSHQALTTGPYGILEPAAERPALPWDTAHLSPDMALVPACACDAHGFRLGYGGGYYDRALNHPCFANTHTVALCYAIFCVQALPHEHWDLPMKALCTEEGLQWL